VPVSAVPSFVGLLLSVAPGSAQATDTQHVYAEDQLTVAPVVLRQPTVYPESLKGMGIGGTVGVSVVLDRKGHPDSGSVRVVSTPDSALNEPARAVVLGSHFAPGRIEDRAVHARVVVQVAFDPRDTAGAPSPVYEEEDSLSQKPALLFGPPIVYPQDLQRDRIQGRVVVQMILDTLGRVEPGSLQFVTTPHPAFLMSVSQYLALARFRPARRNGRLVRSLVHMPLDFRLRGLPFPCQVSDDIHLKCPP
jgi:TonB family protein